MKVLHTSDWHLGKTLEGFQRQMAYILEIQKILGIKLPIVLDSPSGREVDQENISETSLLSFY